MFFFIYIRTPILKSWNHEQYDRTWINFLPQSEWSLLELYCWFCCNSWRSDWPKNIEIFDLKLNIYSDFQLVKRRITGKGNTNLVAADASNNFADNINKVSENGIESFAENLGNSFLIFSQSFSLKKETERSFTSGTKTGSLILRKIDPFLLLTWLGNW